MDIIRTDFDAKFQPKLCCCCISLKVGSTIIAVVNITSLLVSTILLFATTDDNFEIHNETDTLAKAVQTKIARVARAIFNMLLTIVSGLMLYGNIKGDKKRMLPYVYLGLISLGGSAMLDFIMTLTLIALGEFYAGFIVALVISVIFLVQLYFWEVVRCRVLELDHMEQPQTSYTQQDPELPAYGDIQGTTTMEIAEREKSALAYPNDQFNYE